MKLGLAGGCLLLLMLMAAVLTRTRAAPVPGPPCVLPKARVCDMAQFKSLAPRELQAFKTAKDAFEESLLLKDYTCSHPLFPRPWDLRQLQVWERPVALQAELALTLQVLATVANSTLGDVLDQPLRTLGHIHCQLQACALAQPTAGPRPHGRHRHRHRLSHWLQRLQQAPQKETPGCLQISVMFNLFRLLTLDLRCVASGHLCV
ncbi:interferon lambda-3-like [Sciurus carolinensis]|uniref:interferon lambda-3-like n=1 Tax=Sciurus carolinensis TaxID=30640 RepID=UPI001FB1E193|nr:interferon lambda-3-like [Sciurus carolinensis]